jgi:pentatricopeptide repeat protein
MEKGGQWEKAVQTFTAILKQGVEPDAVTYSAIFEALEGNNRPQEAGALFKTDQLYPLSALKVMEQRQAQGGVRKPCLSGFTKQYGRDLCIDLHQCSKLSYSAGAKHDAWPPAQIELHGRAK